MTYDRAPRDWQINTKKSFRLRKYNVTNKQTKLDSNGNHKLIHGQCSPPDTTYIKHTHTRARTHACTHAHMHTHTHKHTYSHIYHSESNEAIYRRKKKKVEGVEIKLAEVGFEQMRLQGSFQCTNWLNVSNFTRQRIPDRRSGIGKWAMSKHRNTKARYTKVPSPAPA